MFLASGPWGDVGKYHRCSFLSLQFCPVPARQEVVLVGFLARAPLGVTNTTTELVALVLPSLGARYVQRSMVEECLFLLQCSQRVAAGTFRSRERPRVNQDLACSSRVAFCCPGGSPKTVTAADRQGMLYHKCSGGRGVQALLSDRHCEEEGVV